MKNILIPFLMTLFSGLCTGLGGMLAFLTCRNNAKLLSVSMGLSAGVMIYVSMAELLGEAQTLLGAVYGEKTGVIVAVLGFFGGMLLIALIDKSVPCEENPHELNCAVKTDQRGNRLKGTGIMTAIAIAMHNFPEGMASFVSATQSLKVAIPIVVAIAIHNVPEGIAVSVPIFYATGSRKKAVIYSFMTGLGEPVGALIGYLILLPFMSDAVFGILFAAVAGIMVFISFDELLPGAEVYGEHHLAVYGLVGGMLLMALSLWMFI